MSEYADARAKTDAQLNHLRNTTASPGQIFEREIVVLNAFIARENAALAQYVAGEAMRAMNVLLRAADANADKIEKAIDRAITATDESTSKLTWATWALAAFALAQVLVAILTWLRPHP